MTELVIKRMDLYTAPDHSVTATFTLGTDEKLAVTITMPEIAAKLLPDSGDVHSIPRERFIDTAMEMLVDRFTDTYNAMYPDEAQS